MIHEPQTSGHTNKIYAAERFADGSFEEVNESAFLATENKWIADYY